MLFAFFFLWLIILTTNGIPPLELNLKPTTGFNYAIFTLHLCNAYPPNYTWCTNYNLAV